MQDARPLAAACGDNLVSAFLADDQVSVSSAPSYDRTVSVALPGPLEDLSAAAEAATAYAIVRDDTDPSSTTFKLCVLNADAPSSGAVVIADYSAAPGATAFLRSSANGQAASVIILAPDGSLLARDVVSREGSSTCVPSTDQEFIVSRMSYASTLSATLLQVQTASDGEARLLLSQQGSAFQALPSLPGILFSELYPGADRALLTRTGSDGEPVTEVVDIPALTPRFSVSPDDAIVPSIVDFAGDSALLVSWTALSTQGGTSTGSMASLCVVLDEDGEVVIKHLFTGTGPWIGDLSPGATRAVFWPANQRDGRVTVIDLATGHEHELTPAAVSAVFTPDDSLVSVRADGTFVVE